MDSGAFEIPALSLLEDQNARETTSSSSSDSPSKDGVLFAAKSHKRISSKDSPRTSLNSLNKKSQIKKPSHRNGSPLNWIPRKKGDTYLKRKIQQLQEASGMNSTLDETLGTANPHYCRVLREKIASRQAAMKAMKARKAAMVEASWCRILKAARIQSKEAETLLLKAEKSATEALEAATAKGVMMYDTVDTTQSLKAPLETAFEVDRQVASAVKIAFIRLAANCPSLNKDEYSGLLVKISENPENDETNQDLSDGLLMKISEYPETDETNQDLSDVTASECITDATLHFEVGCEDSSLNVNQMDEEIKFGMFGRRQSSLNCTNEKLSDIMLGRLKCLKEDELASLATIVATCGLNAALAEMENQHENTSSSAKCHSRRVSTFGSRRVKNPKQPTDEELPSLDKCMIKHMTKLEREVQDARNARKNDPVKLNVTKVASSEAEHEPGLESILVKQSSKLEKEKAELKRKIGQIWESDQKEFKQEGHILKQKVDEVPSLDKLLVKHVSRLEREVQEARSRRNDDSAPGSLANVLQKDHTEKENIESNSTDTVPTEKDVTVKKIAEGGLDSILVKHKSILEREKIAPVQPDYDQPKPSFSRQKARERELQDAWGGMSLDNCVKPHVSRSRRNDDSAPGSLANVLQKDHTEKENIESNSKETVPTEKDVTVKKIAEGGLDTILVKHKSKLDREKIAPVQPDYDQPKPSFSRQKARERELQDAWGGMSLDNCVKPHVSRLEREKAAWIKAEEGKKAAMTNQGNSTGQS